METDKFLKLMAKDVMAKRELSNLSPDYVVEKLKKILDENGKFRKRIFEKAEQCGEHKQFMRTKEHDELMKAARSALRGVYGVFIKDDYKKRYELLERLKKDKEGQSLETHNKILALHQSTDERLPYYHFIYEGLFKATGKPKSIVDLACGLNPISYPYLGCDPEYLACDLAEEDLRFIQSYFKMMKIPGKTLQADLIKTDVSEMTRGKDVCFLFKTLDTLESAKRNISRTLLEQVKSRFIIVSFATKSIGGRKSIRKERRAWFEKMVSRNGWESSVFELPNELFYVVKKTK